MLQKIKAHLGIKLFIFLCIVMILAVVPLSYTALHSMREFGNKVLLLNEKHIRTQTQSYLKKITIERAGRYQAFFNRIAASAGLLSSQASAIYSDISFYAEHPLQKYIYTISDQNGLWQNAITDPVVSIYWGAPEFNTEAKRELQALTHMTRLFKQILLENPMVLASHIITASGAGQYCTNNLKSKEAAFELPPAKVFDLRQGEPFTIFSKSDNISPGVRWTNIYKDDIIDGFMLTASAAIIDEMGVFRGIAGIDVPLDTIVEEVLNYHQDQSEAPILFSFLLDAEGGIIALPQDYYELLGLSVDQKTFLHSDERLNIALSDSTQKAVRDAANIIIENEAVFTKVSLGQENYYIVSSSMAKQGWKVGVVIKESDMLSSLQESRLALSKTMKDFELNGALLSLVTVITALVIVFIMLKYLITPLRSLAAATQRVAGGDLDVRSPVTTTDEAGVLAASFNSMVEELQVSRQQQKSYADSLELEVEHCNIELETKKNEIEKTVELLQNEVERRNVIVEALKNSKKQYYDTLDASVAGVCIIEDGVLTYVNNSFANRLFHASNEELIGLSPLDLVCAEDRQLVEANMKKRLRGIDVAPYTVQCIRKDGSTFYGEVWAKVSSWQNKQVMVGTITDVSDIRLKEEKLQIQDKQLQRSLDEKEVLLKEIYHRTKNNMLVIISMLDLQSQTISDERLKTVFQDIESRIRAMAMVHEKLYQSQNLSEIDMGSYLHDIAESLLANMLLDDRIELQSNMDYIAMNIDYAVPLGLVVNEIITNSIKHAFPDNRSGVVSLYLSKVKEGRIILNVADDGIGLPADIDGSYETSFGMGIIINSLVKIQLKGEISVDRQGGTRYSITFPEPVAAKRI